MSNLDEIGSPTIDREKAVKAGWSQPQQVSFKKEEASMKQFMTLAALMAATLIAPQAKAQRWCSNSDLSGVYNFNFSGSFGTAAIVGAGQTTYDGNGGVTGLIQISLGGTVTPVVQWTGTYVMNTNCTATKTALIPGLGSNGGVLTIHFFITAGADFTELRFIATDPTTVITGSATKQ